MSNLASPHLQRIPIYEPGKPLAEVERELGVRVRSQLASNENPVGPSPLALRALAGALGSVHRYPDGGAYYLKKGLAERLALSPGQILLGNGANELINFAAMAYLSPGAEALLGDPAFIAFRIAVLGLNADPVQVPLKEHVHDLEAMAERVSPKTRLVFIDNPSNPTGTIVGAASLERFLDALPERVVVVLDEAYHEYVQDGSYGRSLDWVREGRPLLVLRTFSKVYGLAGLRVGYCLAREDLVEDLERVRPPFNVSHLAQVAALAALADEEHVRRCLEVNEAGKRYLYDALGALGVEFVPSQANFLLVGVGDGPWAFRELMQRGVVVRPLVGYGLGAHIRVTVGLPEENERFVEALRDLLGGGSGG